MTTLKLLAFFTTYVLAVYGSDVEPKDNVESYITKEAAKELRNKLSARGDQQDQDYDDILKRIIMSVQQPHDNAEQIVYEKKYFDYLPNDLDSEDVTYEDSTHELVKSLDSSAYSKEHETVRDNVRRVNSRKFKRDLTEQGRAKRQSIYYVPVPLVHYNPYPNVNFYAPHNFPEFPPSSALQSRFGSNQGNVSPWSPQNNPGKLHEPYNFYLPAALPGINNPSPPHNPNAVDFDDRISAFEDDDTAQRIWPNINKNSGGGGGGSSAGFRPGSSQRPRTTTQRPQTTTVRQQYGGDTNAIGIGMPDQDVQLEIEYPPDTFELPLTTRAPLRRPTISKNKNPNREKSPNREATLKPTTTTTTASPDRTSGGRQQNKSVPTCVFAITNCCSRYDELVRVSCFEKYNCQGAFFNVNPCSPDIKAAAFREIEKYTAE